MPLWVVTSRLSSVAGGGFLGRVAAAGSCLMVLALGGCGAAGFSGVCRALGPAVVFVGTAVWGAASISLLDFGWFEAGAVFFGQRFAVPGVGYVTGDF